MKHANNRSERAGKWLLAAFIAIVPLLSPSLIAGQTYFQAPDVAANNLVIATARSDEAALKAILGEEFRTVLPLGEIGELELERFFAAWASFHTLVPVDPDTRVLAVGDTGWTLPIPIVRGAEGWRFDTEAGAKEMQVRRIGRNELSAMQALLAYREAQLEYARQDRDGDNVPEYAQRFVSTKGKQDGLYWETAPGQPQSPLGPLFADERPEGAYFGYHYRILTSQGANAPGGIIEYLDKGNMVGGFAVVAWPADYGESGVMSFMLSRDGVLYETDLGLEGGDVANSMNAFDPDGRWSQVDREFTRLESAD